MAAQHSPSDEALPTVHFRNNCRMILKLLQERDQSVAFSPEPPMTPVSSLAFGFSKLHTCEGDTPKRCLDLSNLSTEEGALLRVTDSPLAFSDPVEQFDAQNPLSEGRKSGKGGRCVILPRLLSSTPRSKEPGRESKEMANKENEERLMKPPGRRVPRCLQQHCIAESPPLSLAVQSDVVGGEDCEGGELGSPITLVSGGGDLHRIQPDNDPDGFTEFFTEEEQIEDAAAPVSSLSSSMAALLSGPLLTQDIDIGSVSMNRSRLYRSPSMPEKLDRPMRKRSFQTDDDTPVKMKRSRSTNSPAHTVEEGPMLCRRVPTLRKTLSLCDVDNVFDEDCGHRQLIGDFSKVYALPTVTARYQDLKYVTAETALPITLSGWPLGACRSLEPAPTRPVEAALCTRAIRNNTMAAVLHGGFLSLVEKCVILDCRYPYEYNGGHIQGAINIHRQEDVLDLFLKEPLIPSVEGKRIILIFHCEFSSERGPKMCRFLREEDRDRNDYPSLHYPELYVLKGGYREFFSEYKELCEPQDYCPMHHQDFREEMLQFRTKSKSWAGERRLREQVARLIKM